MEDPLPKKRSTMEVYIPEDVVLNQILPRVPTKSVCRFKCVSKEWYSFLKSDMFINKHNCHVNDHKRNLKLLVLSKSKTSFEFATIDCEAPPSDKGLTPTHRPLPHFGGIAPLNIHVLTSFHGLVCLGIIKDEYDDEYSDLILWNPLTNEYKRLSKLPNFFKYNRYTKLYFELYYSRCEDDYKLLFFGTFGDDVYIYSLRTDSWREVDAFQNTCIIYPARQSRCTYLNENLYFLQDYSDGWLSSIIRFDTITEHFSEIEPPVLDYDPEDVYDFFATIMVINDCIHVCVKYDTWIDHHEYHRPICIKLWELDEDEDMNEVLTYQLRPLPDGHTMNYLIPFHLMQNGNWLMLMDSSYSYNHRIYKVDFKKKMHITNKGKEKETSNIYDDFEYVNVKMDNTNINKLVDKEVGYIETFVSPNRYMK